MNKILLCVALCLSSALAQRTDALDNPTDISSYADLIKQGKLPTPTSVKAARAQATTLFEAKNCTDALPALDNWASQANWLANLLKSGLDPFYNATSTGKKSVNGPFLTELAVFEGQANAYKGERNLANVMKAECMIQRNQKLEAAALLAKTLNYIDVEDRELWDRARNDLFALIEVQ